MPDETRQDLDDPADGDLLRPVDEMLAAFPGPSADFEARVRTRIQARRARSRGRILGLVATAALVTAVMMKAGPPSVPVPLPLAKKHVVPSPFASPSPATA